MKGLKGNSKDFAEIEAIQSYKKGLNFQRERFKAGKDGTGENNFDLMCDALENLKSDLKFKITTKGGLNRIKYVETAIDWYRTLESKYTQSTPEGMQVVLPAGSNHKVNKVLTKCYEFLVEETHKAGLLE